MDHFNYESLVLLQKRLSQVFQKFNGCVHLFFER